MATSSSSSTKHHDSPTDPGKHTTLSPHANPSSDPEAQNYSTFAFPYDPSSPEGVPPPRKQGGGGNLSLVVFGLVIVAIVLLFALS
ncbi:hypothetical protein BDV41DRAFT_539965 [Aspergillus transmontanensis]|uniref:Uncharacterized protein n=1 Tax=Aspergillus transmontanensis TaxID=1034304 RepID=A0A5N6VWU7_9EURO|nr:hypothetical protein BDV41DRAFT_539965 [Aspergillus transmontanensis]